MPDGPGLVMSLVRPERTDDLAQIRAVNELAFGQPEEADLVDQLREDGDVLAIRACILSHRTQLADVEALLEDIATAPE